MNKAQKGGRHLNARSGGRLVYGATDRSFNPAKRSGGRGHLNGRSGAADLLFMFCTLYQRLVHCTASAKNVNNGSSMPTLSVQETCAAFRAELFKHKML